MRQSQDLLSHCIRSRLTCCKAPMDSDITSLFTNCWVRHAAMCLQADIQAVCATFSWNVATKKTHILASVLYFWATKQIKDSHLKQIIAVKNFPFKTIVKTWTERKVPVSLWTTETLTARRGSSRWYGHSRVLWHRASSSRTLLQTQRERVNPFASAKQVHRFVSAKAARSLCHTGQCCSLLPETTTRTSWLHNSARFYRAA